MKILFLFTFLTSMLILSDVDPKAYKQQSLKEALTFYASFDEKTDADFAKGDARIYTADEYDQLPKGKKGLKSKYIQRISDQGVIGGALNFKQKNDHVVFFKAADNLVYSAQDWSGTVSFWLQLDPNQDLEPGYCDPIQITDEGYDDASFWVDFSDKNPRNFRLGVFGDAAVWNPGGGEGGDHPDFLKRLVPAKSVPFSREQWTHVVMRFSHLNTAGGSAQLYLNGKLQGTQQNIKEPFSWELERATIRLGISYVGLMDELAIFNQALSEEEILALYQLKGGVKSIL
ncbi:LamG-like jellyroll fold domain-containing protein [Catalinimonas niigatensis]|uniref:LamG-like jellyroll fold domain-containing protein n=1 Tax=Catalinimonas niigatensis TaxID=1397264 RepID=UPI002666534E|nr:LamG-like jellyroll fold domain-containing protein [Catalinimonas niigatensis]WPP52694.1 LamG-like jellyroll fold domain-containing protein [Catalinimonas niigatensis]